MKQRDRTANARQRPFTASGNTPGDSPQWMGVHPSPITPQSQPAGNLAVLTRDLPIHAKGRVPRSNQPCEGVIAAMNDAIPTTQGTRVCALVYDTDMIQVPGILLHLTPGTLHHQLTVLVRLSTGTFRTEEYLLPPTRSTNRIRHNYLGLPGARLRQAWTDLALWDLLDIQAGLRGPRGGDAVRLTAAWHDADPGDIGVLDGFVGQPLPGEGSITFHPSTFRGRAHDGRIVVRASGHPGSISTPLAELTATGQPTQLAVWQWRDGIPGRGRAQPYTVTVPLWDWTPGTPS